MFDVLFIICLYHRPFDLSLLRLVGPNPPLHSFLYSSNANSNQPLARFNAPSTRGCAEMIARFHFFHNFPSRTFSEARLNFLFDLWGRGENSARAIYRHFPSESARPKPVRSKDTRHRSIFPAFPSFSSPLFKIFAIGQAHLPFLFALTTPRYCPPRFFDFFSFQLHPGSINFPRISNK